VVKAAGMLEAFTALIAFTILLLLAPLAAQYIIKDPGTVGMVTLYGLIILANYNTETATAVLNIGGHFRSQAVVNLIQSIVVTLLIVIAFFNKGDLLQVLTAYMIGKFILGLGTSALAMHYMQPTFGRGWWKSPLRGIEDWREMLKFVINTNLSGTINLFIRDSEVLWVGYFLTPLFAGYYKFGLAVMNVILMPITPFIATTYPEINRTIARQDWGKLRGLLKRTSFIAAFWTVGCGVGLVLVGPWFLNWFKDGAYLPSLPAAIILLIGYGTANIFFWNRNLLLAFNRPDFPLKASFWAGLVKTALMFFLVAPLGYLAQAGLMSLYFLISISAIVWYGLHELKKRERFSALEVSA
jgi:O-antigen/teichoic acid export membrane protein